MNLKYLITFEISKVIIGILNLFFLVGQYPEVSIIISLISIFTSFVAVAVVAVAVVAVAVVAVAVDDAAVVAAAVAVAAAVVAAAVVAAAVVAAVVVAYRNNQIQDLKGGNEDGRKPIKT